MKIDGLIQGQSINLSDLAGILHRVNVGDVIRAKILEITSNSLMLKLFDGSTVKAELASPIEGKQGEFLDLMVKNKTDNQLILETVQNNTAKPLPAENEIKNQLIDFGLKPDLKNVEIANKIKLNNLPLNKEVFEKIRNTVSQFKELTPSKAAFLIAGNLNLEEKNITALTQLVDGKAKITAKLDELINTLGSVKDENVLKSIETQFAKIVQTESTKAQVPPSTQTAQNTASSQPVLNTGETPVNEKALSDNLKNLIKESVQSVETKGIKNVINPQVLAEKIEEFIKSNGITSNSSGKFVEMLSKDIKSYKDIPINEQKSIQNTIENIFLKIKDGAFKKQELFINPKENSVLNNAEQTKTNIQQSVEKLFVNVNSESLKDEINVNNLYKELYGKLEIVKETVGNSVIHNKNDIINQIDNLQNNMRFMNDLSAHNTYIQIPLNIWDKNTTGELYVLKKDKKKKKIDPENVTVFISLNTENLGQIDSLISVNKKNIAVNLRVEDQNIIDFVKENHKELYNKLLDKGYKLVDVKYRIISEESNLLNVKDIVKKETELCKGSIDMKI